MSAKKQNKEPSFEEELARLEALTEQMEGGDLPLDVLLSTYEEGFKLAKNLMERLNAAKAKLSEVTADKDGRISIEPSEIVSQSSLLDDLDD